MSSDEDALAIKPSALAGSKESAGSVQAFPSPQRKKKKKGRTWDLNGINEDEPETYIHRESLVSDAIASAREGRFLVVGSPPGTGKTALSQLIQQKLKKENDSNASKPIRSYRLRPASVENITNLFDYVQHTTGVSLDEFKLSEKSIGRSEVWLLFDDAQKLYGEKFAEFWEHVTKNKQEISKRFGKTKIIVVVFATYYLSNASESPICFENEKRLGLNDLRLQKEEALNLYCLRCMHTDWNEYFERLYYVTNGTAAAFTIGMNRIVSLSETADRRSGGETLSENDALLQLIEKTPFAELKRCFPVTRMNESQRLVILDALVEAYQADMGDDTVDEQRQPGDTVTKLVKAGILTEWARFTSPIAERFYYNHVFPRASSGTDVPVSLDDLIVRATERTSARRLRVASSTKNGVVQSPKEAVFQQLFHEAIASLLPVSYRIIPELGTQAKIDGEVVTGELDFYIKNGKKWALELLRDAKGRKEHLNRIPGKYREVVADAWLVVDCRADGVVPSKRDNNLCTLVFNDDFRSCQCYMRGNGVHTLKLAE
jgi:hypothetical protein